MGKSYNFNGFIMKMEGLVTSLMASTLGKKNLYQALIY
jgi:hypothetical protein